MKRIILALVPGKSAIGIAAFRGLELLHFSMRTLEGKSNSNKSELVTAILVTRLLDEFVTELIVLNPSLRSMAGRCAASIIREAAAVRRLNVVDISTEQAKRTIMGHRSDNRKLFERLAHIYPQIRRRSGSHRWQMNYYRPLFLALAIGLTAVMWEARREESPKQIHDVHKRNEN